MACEISAKGWKILTYDERKQFIKEVENWLTHRDTLAGTWYSSSHKALLQEIYILRKTISKLNKKNK
jgi:hypothetical protein